MRILVVEDERKVAAFIRQGLEEESYTVDVAGTGPDGENLAEQNRYDLIVLDLMLPGKDGVEVCRELRARKVKTPILMLTARTALQDKIDGLDSGADDYLTKPFAFEELLARARALLRRGASGDVLPLRLGDVVLDRATRRVRCGDREAALTNREFAVLEYFMHRAGQVISRSVLAEQVWGIVFDPESNVIDVTVGHLRSKLEWAGAPPMLHTVRGIGYVLDQDRKQ